MEGVTDTNTNRSVRFYQISVKKVVLVRLCGPTSARRLARAPILPINRCARNTAADKKAANARSPGSCQSTSLFLTLPCDRTVFGCAGH